MDDIISQALASIKRADVMLQSIEATLAKATSPPRSSPTFGAYSPSSLRVPSPLLANGGSDRLTPSVPATSPLLVQSDPLSLSSTTPSPPRTYQSSSAVIAAASPTQISPHSSTFRHSPHLNASVGKGSPIQSATDGVTHTKPLPATAPVAATGKSRHIISALLPAASSADGRTHTVSTATTRVDARSPDSTHTTHLSSMLPPQRQLESPVQPSHDYSTFVSRRGAGRGLVEPDADELLTSRATYHSPPEQVSLPVALPHASPKAAASPPRQAARSTDSSTRHSLTTIREEQKRLPEPSSNRLRTSSNLTTDSFMTNASTQGDESMEDAMKWLFEYYSTAPTSIAKRLDAMHWRLFMQGLVAYTSVENILWRSAVEVVMEMRGLKLFERWSTTESVPLHTSPKDAARDYSIGYDNDDTVGFSRDPITSMGSDSGSSVSGWSDITSISKTMERGGAVTFGGRGTSTVNYKLGAGGTKQQLSPLTRRLLGPESSAPRARKQPTFDSDDIKRSPRDTTITVRHLEYDNWWAAVSELAQHCEKCAGSSPSADPGAGTGSGDRSTGLEKLWQNSIRHLYNSTLS